MNIYLVLFETMLKLHCSKKNFFLPAAGNYLLRFQQYPCTIDTCKKAEHCTIN